MSDTPREDALESGHRPSTSPNPIRRFLVELRQDLRHNGGVMPLETRDVVTFVFIAVLLAVFYYWGRPGFFGTTLWRPTAEALSISRDDRYYQLLPYAYWGVMSVVVRMLVPCAFIWVFLRERVRDHGYRVRGVTWHAWVYLLLFVAMLPVLYLVSLTSGFQNKYPLCPQARLGWDYFLLWQLCYGAQFVALEAFFRGFMIFALFKRFGYYALLIMMVPYCMIHFTKPPLETFGAIAAGLVLGYLALKSRSWVFGALLHWGVGITMDLLAIMHRGGFQY